MNPFINAQIQLFNRDLTKLEEEIKMYPNEDSLWIIKGEIKNAGGNLCLHLCGNLQHYIGAILGQSGYRRNRDYEFSARNVQRDTLLTEIHKTREVVSDTLKALSPTSLEANYPQDVLGYTMTTTYFLIHLNGHFNYHLGQINYLRRLL